MRRTNYQRIAQIYDNNELRRNIAKDTVLEQIVSEKRSEQLRVLDLACGTGNYLQAQQEAFKDEAIQWFGFDLSEAMLARAKQKIPSAILTRGSAELLPYEKAFFDFVSCDFALHHFPEKERALGEIYRVLKISGKFKLWNIDPYAMKKWWLYAYFPKCYVIDQERFWSVEKLFRELEILGFSVTSTTTKTLSRKPLEEIYKQSQPRDISQLDLLDDAKFQEGLRWIERDMRNQVESIVSEDAVVKIVGQKQA